MYRSMLYVPASSERFIAKAAERGADALILDLEDSVVPEERASARARLQDSVRRCGSGGADVWIRINRPLALAVLDVAAAARSAARGIFLTKAESADHVRLVIEAAEVETQAAGRAPLQVVVMIETPAAVLRAAEIAAAHPLVVGVLAGGEDLATMMDAEPTAETLRVPKLMIHIAAKAGGRYSFGTLGTVADFSDTALIGALANEAARHGFTGATCVHPSAVPILNDAFGADAGDLARAEAIVSAADRARAEGLGAFVHDGRMIDEPVVERARRLLRRARTQSGKRRGDAEP